MPDVPPLRFPEFTGEWQCKAIEKVAPLQRGFDLPTQNLVEGIYPVIYSNGILQHHDKYKCEAPGLITGRSGTIGKFTYIDSGFYWPHNTSLWVTDFCGNCPKFIYYLYQTVHIEQFSTGSGVPTLNRNDVHRYKTSVPTAIVEQEKIAKFLSILDERIVTQNKIIDKLQSLIKGINCKIFALIQGNEYRLGDIATITNGNSNVQDASVEYRVGLYPFFDRSEDVKYLPTFLFDKESIIYPGEGTEFMPRYYNGKFALHQRCYAICDFNEAVNPQFLYFFLKTQNSYFIRNAVGSTVPSLRLDTFQKLKVVIPSKETQYSVYSFLSTLEQKLDVENSIMKMLLCQKRYLLRQMFI
ncbi:restriction endonuclease subunit S [Bacteroides stercoris]|uniref:restriction endonuclease subunit S n=1 Tax=Bacteroides stercoris TaxID=46506 RepID=UPI0028933681|nr:restriction endonuclease subunit S [Bacteroides stercoris]